MARKQSGLSIVLGSLLLLTACTQGGSPAARGGADTAETPHTPTTLTIAIQREITAFDNRIAVGTGSGAWRHWVELAEEPMTSPSRIPAGEREMRLATKLPSQADGTWAIHPDGRMDMTWTIVNNAKWHDGMPVTVDDIIFTVTMMNDPDVPQETPSGGAWLIKGFTKVNDYTVTAHWGQPSVLGRYGDDIHPLPKHIFEPIYQRNKSELGRHAANLHEYIGAGPFRLVRYEPASFIEFERFMDYYKGPAKIDRVLVQIVPDPNVMVAHFLSGVVDVLTPPAIGMEIAAEMKGRFQREGTGHQVLIGERSAANNYELMVDAVYARPVNGMTQQKVRQAGLQAINREELMDLMTLGGGAVARQPYHPTTDPYRYLKDYINSRDFPWNYPYDLRRAEQLMAEAGWTRGPDGILVHSPSGERFDYQVLIRRGTDWEKENSIIRDDLKKLGINLELHTLTATEQNDQKFISTKPGAANITSGAQETRRYLSKAIPDESNNWSGGSNRGRWSEPRMDRLIAAVEVAVRDDEARSAYRAYTDHVMDQVTWWPFYWEPIPWIVGQGVSGIIPYGANQDWWADVVKK
ncbi:MAG: hypothetical protein HY534_05265 [Chloroflexi bacterium]|nr:hypothetical protein [Chloroflexota bacterium]